MNIRAATIRRRSLLGILGLLVVVVVFVAVFVIRISFGGGPVNGRVVDIDTKLPIADAIVVARWQRSALTIAHSTSYCYHVETAVSDKEGRYRVSRWWRFPPVIGSDGMIGMDAYVHGYETVAPPANARSDDVYVQRFIGSRDERFEFLSSNVFSGMDCLGSDASRHNLFTVFRAALAEAKGIAGTQSQERDVQIRMRRITAAAWLARPSDSMSHPGNLLDLLPRDVRKEIE